MSEPELSVDPSTKKYNDMSHRGRLDSFAHITVAALIGLTGVSFGDENTLAPVRVEGDAADTAKMATQSYKFCWSATRGVNGMREDRFFAEPIVEAKGHKVAPADTILTIQSQSGPINIPVSRDGAIEDFPISTQLLAENPLVVSNKPKGSLDLAGGLYLSLAGCSDAPRLLECN